MITFDRFEQRMKAIFKNENVCINCLSLTLHEHRDSGYRSTIRSATNFEVQEVVDSIRDLDLNPDDLCGEGHSPFFKGMKNEYLFGCFNYQEFIKKVKELYDARCV